MFTDFEAERVRDGVGGGDVSMFSAASGEACSLRRGRDGVGGGDVSMFSAVSGEACSLRRVRDVFMFSGRGKW
jgi:hypothetical protein